MATIQGLPETMSACQIVEFSKPHEVREIPTPTTLGPYDVLLKVVAAGVCHTDLDLLRGYLINEVPMTGSHEGTGVAVAIGEEVKNFKVGDRVLAGQTSGRCGKCEFCQGPEKTRHYCENRDAIMAVGRNGAWQEYLIVDSRESAHIPDEMSMATAAPLACAGATSWRAVDVCELQPGEWIGIIGSGGGLGHLAVQFAKAKGLRVLAVDAREEALALSREKGADVVLDARDGLESLGKEARRITGCSGVSATVVVSGHSTAPDSACAITKLSGTVVQVSVIDPLVLPFLSFIFKDLRLRGSFLASQGEIQEMLHFTVKHKITVENNLFHGLHEVTRAVEMLRNAQYRGKATVIIDEDEFKKDCENGRV